MSNYRSEQKKEQFRKKQFESNSSSRSIVHDESRDIETIPSGQRTALTTKGGESCNDLIPFIKKSKVFVIKMLNGIRVAVLSSSTMISHRVISVIRLSHHEFYQIAELERQRLIAMMGKELFSRYEKAIFYLFVKKGPCSRTLKHEELPMFCDHCDLPAEVFLKHIVVPEILTKVVQEKLGLSYIDFAKALFGSHLY